MDINNRLLNSNFCFVLKNNSSPPSTPPSGRQPTHSLCRLGGQANALARQGAGLGPERCGACVDEQAAKSNLNAR